MEWIALDVRVPFLGDQNIQARASDKRFEDTHKDADAVLHEALEIQAHLEAQDAVIAQILSQVKPTAG